jgi:hypothetical protein
MILMQWCKNPNLLLPGNQLLRKSHEIARNSAIGRHAKDLVIEGNTHFSDPFSTWIADRDMPLTLN